MLQWDTTVNGPSKINFLCEEAVQRSNPSRLPGFWYWVTPDKEVKWGNKQVQTVCMYIKSGNKTQIYCRACKIWWKSLKLGNIIEIYHSYSSLKNYRNWMSFAYYLLNSVTPVNIPTSSETTWPRPHLRPHPPSFCHFFILHLLALSATRNDALQCSTCQYVKGHTTLTSWSWLWSLCMGCLTWQKYGGIKMQTYPFPSHFPHPSQNAPTTEWPKPTHPPEGRNQDDLQRRQEAAKLVYLVQKI